ncbi:MAG TPA: GyrI-like domain-containing protein [Kineosporiaceae bacterium]|nr:GyrI-like domain-containing protein [Kineosporiaceae bacterium]
MEPDERTLYRPPTDPVLVLVPAFEFALIDGQGDPNTSEDYRLAVQALYAVSYPVVMTLKRRGRPDLKVRPLEGLWWADDLSVFDPGREDRGSWRWTMMIRQPDDVPRELYDTALAKAAAKVGPDVAGRVRVEPFDEGLCAQLLHRGPYAQEGPNIQRLHAFATADGRSLRGRHHEIYLSDPRRAAPERMRTILRQPVRDV